MQIQHTTVFSFQESFFYLISQLNNHIIEKQVSNIPAHPFCPGSDLWNFPWLQIDPCFLKSVESVPIEFEPV